MFMQSNMYKHSYAIYLYIFLTRGWWYVSTHTHTICNIDIPYIYVYIYTYGYIQVYIYIHDIDICFQDTPIFAPNPFTSKVSEEKNLPKAYEEWDKVTPADLRGT